MGDVERKAGGVEKREQRARLVHQAAVPHGNASPRRLFGDEVGQQIHHSVLVGFADENGPWLPGRRLQRLERRGRKLDGAWRMHRDMFNTQ